MRKTFLRLFYKIFTTLISGTTLCEVLAGKDVIACMYSREITLMSL